MNKRDLLGSVAPLIITNETVVTPAREPQIKSRPVVTSTIDIDPADLKYKTLFTLDSLTMLAMDDYISANLSDEHFILNRLRRIKHGEF